jgi:hypothetical protein
MHIDDLAGAQDVERVRRPKLGENPPQLRDADLDRTRHRSRGVVSPDEPDEAADGSDPIGVQRQDRAEGTLRRRAELKARAVGNDLEGSPDSVFRQMLPAGPPTQHARRGSLPVSLRNRGTTAAGALTDRVPHV